MDRDFEEIFFKKVSEIIDDKKKSIIIGGYQNYTEYKSAVGFLNGAESIYNCYMDAKKMFTNPDGIGDENEL